MRIENGILQGARWVKANASGGAMTPRWTVLHDTAGRLEPFSSVNWFASKECKTSAHFVVERDGTITQMVPTNRRAFHAGVSTWKGVQGLNSCSVGIEIVNPGKLDEKGNAWFGKAAEPADIVAKSTPNHGKGWWLPYTPQQIAAVKAICRAVIEEYPDCNEIVTHWQIAPKRKIDPCPLFPLEEVQASIFDPTPGEIEHTPQPDVPTTPPPAPSVAVEAVKSPTVWMLLTAAVGTVVDAVFGAVAWLGDRLGDVLAALSKGISEADTALAPLLTLGSKLHLNIGRVATVGFVGFLAVALIRHVRDKVELKRLKQQVPPQGDAT